MIEPAGGDFVVANLEGVSAAHFLKLPFGAHCGHVDWEIGDSHLRFEDLLQAIAAQVFGAVAIEMELISFGVQRSEEGNALNVVPVIMGNEDMSFVRMRSVGRSVTVA